MKQKRKKSNARILVAILIIILIGNLANVILISHLIRDLTERDLEKIPKKITLKKYDPVCYKPIDCFSNSNEFRNQFPFKRVPKIYNECLVYCIKTDPKELYPIRWK